MKRIHAIWLALLLLALTAQAVPPKRVLFPVKQSDGTVVMLYKHGHNGLDYYSTPDGKVVRRNVRGLLCYAALEAGRLVPTGVQVHNPADRTAEEAAFVRRQALPSSSRELKATADRRFPARHALRKPGNTTAGTADGLGKLGTPSNGAVNSIGAVTIPVVLVQFADTKLAATTTESKISRMYNEEGYHDEPLAAGSMKDYFKHQSRGLFDPTFDVVATVTLSGGYATYGKNVEVTVGTGADAYSYETDAGFTDSRTFLNEAIATAKTAGVDFSKYEVDGSVPLIAFLYAGEGEASSYEENTIWPHTDFLTEPVQGVMFDSYFVGNEIACDFEFDWNKYEYVTTNPHLDGIGTFCHEFGHALGLPDFYWTGEVSDDDVAAMAYWSIMDMGSYANDGFAPVDYIAYERSFMGWLDIPEMPAEGSVTLSTYEDADGTPAVLVRHPSDELQYCILENHRPCAWNTEEMGSGMLATLFWYNAEWWEYNCPNYDEEDYNAIVLTPSGSLLTYSDENYAAHLYGNGTNTLSRIPFLDGTSLRKGLTDITKTADDAITFSVGDAPTSGAGFFDRVTSNAQLESGKKYLLVYEADATEGMAFAGMNAKNYGEATAVTLENGTIDNTTAAAVAVELVQSGSNWLIKTDEGYLAYTSTATKSNNNLWAVSDAGTNGTLWTIDAASGSIQNVFNTSRFLQYNKQSTGLRFSGYTGTQQDVYLYKEQTPTGIGSVTTQPAAGRTGLYDLSGRRVQQFQKGLYIQNGKKVVVK